MAIIKGGIANFRSWLLLKYIIKKIKSGVKSVIGLTIDLFMQNVNTCQLKVVFFSIDFFINLFSIGDVVKHRHFNFRGVIYDVDFEFNNSEEWYKSIPKDVRPRKDQPFYHLLAENNDITYEAYVSEQNLISDDSDEPIKHPLIEEIFTGKKGSSYFRPSN